MDGDTEPLGARARVVSRACRGRAGGRCAAHMREHGINGAGVCGPSVCTVRVGWAV